MVGEEWESADENREYIETLLLGCLSLHSAWTFNLLELVSLSLFFLLNRNRGENGNEVSQTTCAGIIITFPKEKEPTREISDQPFSLMTNALLP